MTCGETRSLLVMIADDMEDWRESDDPLAPLPFDRRRNDRWPLEGTGRVVLLDSEYFGQHRELDLLDYSPGGIGAICSMPIHPGTIVSIDLAAPLHAVERGTVVKCYPCGYGYRVAIRFDLRMAA